MRTIRQCKFDERIIVSEKLADQMKDHEINYKKHSKSKSAPSVCIELRKKMICGMIIIQVY